MTQKAPMSKPLTADEIRAQHEINGARRANANLIAYALEQLKPGDERTNLEKLAALTLERERIFAALRRLAMSCGADGEWKEGLSPSDIIEDIEKVVISGPPFGRVGEEVPKTQEKAKR
jgi:hypothetical protein